MSEQEVITLCQKWKLEHFSEVYETYFDKIYKFVFLKTYDKELAQDITSETFLKALDKINTFKNNKESSFKAWIYRIAYNLVIDDYKVAKRKISIDEIMEFWYEADFAKDIDNKDKIREIFNFFETLNSKHKQILIMRIWDDLSFKEISELTGESVDNCKKIVSRTMIKLGTQYMWLLFILLFV